MRFKAIKNFKEIVEWSFSYRRFTKFKTLTLRATIQMLIKSKFQQ